MGNLTIRERDPAKAYALIEIEVDGGDVASFISSWHDEIEPAITGVAGVRR